MICLVGVLRNVRTDAVKQHHGLFWEVTWSEVQRCLPLYT